MIRTYPTTSYLTAITRVAPSAPARYLHEADRLRGRCLDYGCGRGKDADTYGMDKYDPHFFPQAPTGTYDTITCTYVLNVLDPEDVPKVLQEVCSLLAPGGTAYFSVRRDLKSPAVEGRGTTQHNVVINAPILRQTRGYCLYVLADGVYVTRQVIAGNFEVLQP